MVSFSRRRLKKPSPVFYFLDWIKILCSGCFGKMGHFKRPLLKRPPPPYLLENPSLELNVKMDNMALHSNVNEDEDDSTAAHPCPLPPIKPLAWKLSSMRHVDDDAGDIVPFDDNDDHHHTDDDDPYAENDDSDGMFHGLFFMGSKVLTELEMQSPVEECKVFATPVRTPRRSNNSSCASSTRELHLGSWQVPALDVESSSSSDAMAIVSPSQDSMATSSTNCVNAHEQRNAIPTSSLCLNKQHRTSCHSEFTPRTASDALDKGRGHGGSIPDDDIVRFSSLKESSRIFNEEKVWPSLRSSPDGEQSQATCTDEECQVRIGSSSDCTTGDESLKPRKNSHAFACRAAEKQRVIIHGVRDQIPVGSFPDCSRKSNFLIRGRQNNNNGGVRRARSLTDQDFTELRGCIDLGFVFTQDHIPDLRDTLPALEVCYAIAHGAVSPVRNSEDSKTLSSPGSPPISPWRIACPGDQPQQVKARLRHWAQAVACNVRQAC